MNNNLLDFITLYGVFIVGEILLLLTFLHMLYQRRSPTSLISWLLFMVVMPYVSVILYFIIGRRKQPEGKCKTYLEIKNSGHESAIEVNSVDGILRANGITGVSENNSFKLITDSVKAFDAMLEQINNANSSISISTYVFKNDAVTKKLLAALTEKALKGVHVRILIDSLGSYSIYFFQGLFKKLRQAGGDVHFFMPLLRLSYQNHVNLRNHRKIYLFVYGA
jgi:cardiolipin synthase